MIGDIMDTLIDNDKEKALIANGTMNGHMNYNHSNGHSNGHNNGHSNGVMHRNGNNNTGEVKIVEEKHVNLKKRVGLLSGVALIVGTMIGKHLLYEVILVNIYPSRE